MPFKPLSCVYGKVVIPQRYIMMVMVCLGLLNCYHLRVVLNIAITEMIKPSNDTTNPEYDSCPEFEHEKLDIEGGTYEWPTTLRAFILYAFYIGYILSHMPGGWLADKIGPRYVMTTCVSVSVIVTFLFPFSVNLGGHVAAIVLRGILGVVQGPVYPTASSFLQNWAPASERAMMGGVVFSGGNLGAFSGNMFTGMIIKQTKSWPMAFYIWGVVAALWFTFALFMLFSYPSTHPFITEGEMEHLKTEIVKKAKFTVPWKRLLTSIPVWAIVFCHLGHDYIYFTLVTDLPKYMKDILKMNVQANALFSSVPFLCMGVCNICFACLSDVLLRRGLFKKITLRRVYSFTGNICPAICTLGAAYLGCSRLGALALYILGLSLMSFYYSGAMVNVNDISRHYSGVIMAWVNGASALMGIMGPFVVGHITTHGTLQEWRWVFWIMFGWALITSTIYVIFTKTERQDWDYTEEEREEEKAQAQ